VALAFPEQEAVLLQPLEAALDGRLAVAAAACQVRDAHPPAVPVRADEPEDSLRLEGDLGVAEQAVGDLGELVRRHHPTADPRPEAGRRLTRRRGGERRTRRRGKVGVDGSGTVRDRVDDLAERPVVVSQLFADEVAVPLQFAQAAAYGVACVGSGAHEVGDRHVPAGAVGADVAEGSLRLEGDLGFAEQAVGDLGELVRRHHPTADPRPEAAHRASSRAVCARPPMLWSGRAGARWPGPLCEVT
jgi:hypothetical protein